MPLVALMPDTEAKIATVHQANEECKHILLLEKLADHLGFAIDDSMVEPQWANVRQHFHDAAKKKNLAGCLIIQDLMVESLAIGLYKLFSSASNGDYETNRIAANLLKDELEHLELGVNRIQALIAKDSEAVHDSLVWAHHRVMPNLFEMVYESCNFLCKNQDLDCDTVDKGSVAIDLNALKVASLEHYVDTALVRARPDLLSNVRRGHIIQRIPGAESAGQRELLVAVRSHPRRRADEAHDLEGGERDTATNAPDQNVIALLDASARHDHSPRG